MVWGDHVYDVTLSQSNGKQIFVGIMNQCSLPVTQNLFRSKSSMKIFPFKNALWNLEKLLNKHDIILRGERDERLAPSMVLLSECFTNFTYIVCEFF